MLLITQLDEWEPERAEIVLRFINPLRANVSSLGLYIPQGVEKVIQEWSKNSR